MDPFDIEIKAGQPAYRQITDLLRERIVCGALPEGTRFPPIGKLATRWKTNYFTLQTALVPLANEGLIESSPRAGTFVRGGKPVCNSIGLYFGVNFWRTQADGFYSILFGILCERLNELGIKPHLWIDHRPNEEQNTPWPELLKAVDRREVQGVIATMVSGTDVDWLQELPVPICLAWEEDHPATVSNDMKQMLVTSVARLKERGCSSVGLISNHSKLVSGFRREAKKHGLQTADEWIHISSPGVVSEKMGSALFQELWSQKSKPDGLLVFPDVYARGVMIAMLEERVRVPKDLKVIFHLNAELSFYCPLPVDWIVTRAALMADALINSIRRQVAGEPPTKIVLPMELVHGTRANSLA